MTQKLTKLCEICGVKKARGFGFKFAKDYEAQVEIYRAKEKSEFPHEEGPLTGDRLQIAVMDEDSSIRREIRRKDAFCKENFPKDEIVVICYDCADGNGINYFVTIRDFIISPFQFVDWITHLDGKQWMSWDNFVKACKRLRKS